MKRGTILVFLSALNILLESEQFSFEKLGYKLRKKAVVLKFLS